MTSIEDAPGGRGRWRSLLADLKGARPGDVARWAFWVPFRDLLDPDRPELLRALYPLWRVQYAAAGRQREAMADEYRRCFDEDPEPLVREAYRIAFRNHLEELLLGKLTPENWSRYLVFDGREHLDAALDRGKGAIILFPHAGNFMLMIAAVSLCGYPYTQYAARGMAPPEVAQAHPDVFARNRWREEARLAREANEDRLPARFITMKTPLRHLYRCLARNEIVGLAFDGRIGSRFVPFPFLGRQALLNPGAYRLAASTGAAIVPTLCSAPADGPNVCTFGEPIHGDDWRDLMERYVHGAVEPWIRAHKGEYGFWLAHCRLRNDVDDHPLFTDHAPDDRWRVHLERIPR